MNEEQFILFLEYLDKVGVKLGVGIQGIWPWFVKQQYVEAGHSFVLAIICLITSYFSARFLRNHWNPDNEESYSIVGSRHKEESIICLIVVYAVTVFFVAGFIGNFANIFNPEYHAFKDLVVMITPDVVKTD